MNQRWSGLKKSNDRGNNGQFFYISPINVDIQKYGYSTDE